MKKIFIILMASMSSLALAKKGATPNRKIAQSVNINGMAPDVAFKEFMVDASKVKVSSTKGEKTERYDIVSPVKLTPNKLLVNKAAATLHSVTLVLLSDGNFIVNARKDSHVEFVRYEGALDESVVSDAKNTEEELIKGKWSYEGVDISLEGVGTLKYATVNGKGAVVFLNSKTSNSKIVSELPDHIMLTK